MRKILSIKFKSNCFIFFVYVFSIISLIESADIQIKQYNYISDIPKPKFINLSSSIPIQTQTYQLDVINEVLIKQPKQIGSVFQIEAKSLVDSQLDTDNQQKSKNNQSQKNQPFTFPQLNGVRFSSFSWPIKKATQYYSIHSSHKDQQSQLSSSQIQIISATHSHQISENNKISYYPLLILLSNGTIQIISNEEEMSETANYNYGESLILKKSYHFKNQNKKGDNNQTNLNYDVNADIYQRNGVTYLLFHDELHKVHFIEQSDNKQVQSYQYTLQPLFILEQESQRSQQQASSQHPIILKVIPERQYLYVFNDLQWYRIKENQQKNDTKGDNNFFSFMYQNVYAALSFTSIEVRDFEVYHGDVFLLDGNEGIIRVRVKRENNQQNKIIGLSILRIQKPQYALKVRIYNEVILVTYEISEQNYLGQYIFDESNQKLYLNKFYTDYGQIDQVLMFSEFFLIDRGAQTTIARHSTNRNYPLIFHKRNQNLQTISFSQVLKMDYVIQSFSSTFPSYMIVTPEGIQTYQFQRTQNYEFEQRWVKISPSLAGKYSFSIKYTGTCKNKTTWQQASFCSITKNIQLNIKDTTKQKLNEWWWWLCGSIGVTALLFIAFFLLYKYFKKKNSQFQSLLNERKKFSLSFIQMPPKKASSEEKQSIDGQ